MNLILGSNSPRRAQLMHELGFTFEKRGSNVDETIPDDVPLREAATYLAKKKNNAIDLEEGEVLITADTVVLLENEILGKPDGPGEAFQMLRSQSGKVHEVITGVCIRSNEKAETFDSTTKVKFREFEDWEINYYVENFKPFDKAGAYGIQEWIGQVGIEWIEGSYYNVVGLPTEQVFEQLVVTFGLRPD